MRRIVLPVIVLALLLAALLVPLAAAGHPERTTVFPYPATGSVPAYRTTGPNLVVCKSDSAARLAAEYGVSPASAPPAVTAPDKVQPPKHRRHKHHRRGRHHRHRHHRGRHHRGRHHRSKHHRAKHHRSKHHHAKHRKPAPRPTSRPGAGPSSSSGGPVEYQQRVALLDQCGFHDIQAAVNAAQSGYRIQIMPGLYQEQPSRDVPVGSPGQPPCQNNYVTVEGDFRFAPPPVGPASNDPPDRADRNYAINCPNSKNLIAVVGDTRPEPNPLAPILPQCLRLCNLQIEGMGRGPEDVVIQGDRRKSDALRIDRANGIYLTNFTVEQAAFNDIDLVELDGFAVDNVITRYAQNYGVLSFTATHGLYDHITAYNNGDSGVYPGSTMKGCGVNPNQYGTCEASGCGQPSIEIRNSVSYGNTLGYSGTAGNSTYVHDNKFFDNASGLATDSFASGHPGMPQECFDWERNQIYSNNNNVFAADRQAYCAATPFANRPREIVCPQFQAPVGTGVVMGGANRDLLKNNYIYDNWRQGVLLLSVPAAIRGDTDPTHQTDTSNGNQFIANFMGQAPDGSRQPNGLEFRWDGGGKGNCFQDNTMRSGHGSDPVLLPACPGAPIYLPPLSAVTASQLPCTAWDPNTNPEPVGCDWFTTPPRPS
ncbi:MAG: hypothetical protein ACR2ND_04875 [Solirubrobacteraceae bacterium]